MSALISQWWNERLLPEKSKPIKSEEASLQVYESTLVLRHFWPAMTYETQSIHHLLPWQVWVMAMPVPVVSLGEYEELKAEVSNNFKEGDDSGWTQETSPTHLILCAGCVPVSSKTIQSLCFHGRLADSCKQTIVLALAVQYTTRSNPR